MAQITYIDIPASNYPRLETWAWFLEPLKTNILDQELYWRLQQLAPGGHTVMGRASIRLLPVEVTVLIGWFDQLPDVVRDPSDEAYAEALQKFIDRM